MDFFFLFLPPALHHHPPFSPILSGAPSRPPFPFSPPKSKADTLNAVNDIDLNLWRRRVISVGGCALVEQREGQGVWGVGGGSGRGPCASAWAKKKKKKESKALLWLALRLTHNVPWGSLSDCVTENRWTASLRLVLYTSLSIMIHGAILSTCRPAAPQPVLFFWRRALLVAIVPDRRLWSGLSLKWWRDKGSAFL